MNISFPKMQSLLWADILIHHIILSFKPGVIIFLFHECSMSVLSCTLITTFFLSQHVISLQYLRTTTYSVVH
jgi:hypothetical protein